MAWIKVKEYRFNQGDNVLDVVKTPSQNLLASSWLSSLQDNIVAYQEIDNWLPNETYKLDIEIKESAGILRLMVVEAEEYGNLTKSIYAATKQLSDNIALLDEQVDTLKQPRIVRLFKSGDYGKKAMIVFMREKLGNEAKVQIKNASMTMVTVPRMLAVKKNSSEAQRSEIAFRKVNPTKYLADIESGENIIALVFSETFDHGWKAKIGGKTIPEEQHLIVNGYANSWVLLPQDTQGVKSYQVAIEYQPQRSIYFGLVVSGITCLLSLLFILFRK